MSIKKLITGLTLSLLLSSGCGPVDTVLYVIPAAVTAAEVVVSEFEKGISQHKERKKRKERKKLLNDQVVDNKRQAKAKAKANDNAKAFGQALSAGLQAVNKQNLAGPGAGTTNQNNAPAVIGSQNVPYKQSGNTSTFTFGSDGTSTQTIGNFTFGSDGTSTQKIGNFTFGSDGTSTQKIGNFTFGSDGTSTQKIGNSTFGSDGTVCQTIGNTTYCN